MGACGDAGHIRGVIQNLNYGACPLTAGHSNALNGNIAQPGSGADSDKGAAVGAGGKAGWRSTIEREIDGLAWGEVRPERAKRRGGGLADYVRANRLNSVLGADAPAVRREKPR